MRKNYKLCSLLLIFFLSVTASYAQGAAQVKKRIGIFFWNNDQRYLDARDVILEEFRKEGFAESDIEFILGQAGGNKVKAAEIAKGFAVAKLDMCLVFGTPGTQALMKEVKDVPIIFTIIYDPVKADIAKSWEGSGNNSAGSSNYFPMSMIVGKLLEMAPTVKNIAVLYVPGESNSEDQLKDLQKIEGELPIKIIPLPVKSREEVLLTLPYAAEKSDAIYVTGSTVSVAAIADIVSIANKAKKITLCHTMDYVPQGVLLGIGADFKEVAKIAAEKAILVLKGANPSTLPIGLPSKLVILINAKSAREANITIPSDFLKSADKIFDPERVKKRIGILLWTDDQRYLDAKAIILEELKKQGIAEPNTEFIVGLAGGDKAKLLEIAKRFAADKLDMCISLGTQATQALVKEVKNTPIIFSMVYDPLQTKIAASLKSSGNNTTGSSNFIPMTRVINLLKEVILAKNISVFYSPGESQSEAQLRDLQRLEIEYKIKFIPVPVKTEEELVSVLPYAIEKSDVIYITGSSVLILNIEKIIEAANKAGKLTVSHLLDYSPKGLVLGVGADYNEVARLAGEKAVMVLRGAIPSSLPIGLTDKIEVVVNMKSAKAARINIPDEFLKSVAAKRIE